MFLLTCIGLPRCSPSKHHCSLFQSPQRIYNTGVSLQTFAINSFIMFRSPSLQPHDAQRSAKALPMQYSGSERSRRSTASDNPTDLFRPLVREGPQSQRGFDAERPGSHERYHSTARAGRYIPEGSPLPFIPSKDSNVTVNSPTSFTRPVPG